ncbi:class I adenylate-forming enzyme family protein [Beijerinckia sp. L45]|uniref:class I adenylate-forming enzyme family protein n=1 Tax=Beijerinckia sp. L45 TaxID=1641855 RepID=UPI00131E0E95|nr:class I adenylate-forming enzyme family protein [Beijerinckia sp. L45]
MTRAAPVMSIAEAHRLLTSPGARFEMEALDRGGRPVRAWKNGPKSLVDLYMGAAAFSTRTFMVYEQERVSFDAFRRAAMAFAQALIAHGVAKGDRVAIVMRNQPEWPVVFYGVALVGGIATPLNAWWSAAELAFAIKQSGATVAVFDEERFERVRDVLPECADVRLRFVSRHIGPVPDGVRSLEGLIGRPDDWARLPPAGAPPRAVGPEDSATLFYTSGTSGLPKGVLATHRAVTTPIFATLLSHARAFVRRGEVPPVPDPNTKQKRYLLAIPLFHVTGCFSTLAIAMAVGGMLVLLRKWEPEAAMALIARERIAAIGGVPTIAWQLLEHPRRHEYDLSSVDAVSYGGAPAAAELVRRLRQDFPAAHVGCGWGMTETCATLTHHFAEDCEDRPESCGPATPVADLKIVDADGVTLPIGEIGELWVRGPHVITGYWGMPEAAAAADGWLRTGDLARLDHEGFCYIVDRAKDVIIRGGENIYSVEVENVLYHHPAVMDAALVPIFHPILGEEAGAVVTLKPGAQASEDELKAFVRHRLAAFKTPTRILTHDAPLPRNANGKIIKAELRKLFVGRASTEPIEL